MTPQTNWGRTIVRSVVLCLMLAVVSCSTRATIRYDVSLAHPEQHLFHVTMSFLQVAGEVEVQIPAWNALYQIRDFSSRIQQVEAFAGETKLPIEKVDKQTWRIKGSGMLQIRYATYWDENGPFASQLNVEHAFINPAMILMYVPERRNERVAVLLEDVPANWGMASASERSVDQFASVLALGSSTYDQLCDGPIELGNFQQFDLPDVSPRVTVVVHGDGWRKKKIEEELKRIVQFETKLMDGAPFERYTFILHFGRGAGGGGMEHANSTAIGIPSDEYLSGVAAHEFFHLWNVKRIRPASLEPIDYSKEQYTRALWFAEGVTSTYGSFTLVRSGIWNKQQYYADLGEKISELELRPANKWQSAEQSSLDAWLEKYSSYNKAEDSVSYYTKGQVLGDLLDILIRDRTTNAKSLDDVMRGMNADFAKQGIAYRDSLDIRLSAEKVAGGSFEDFFEKYVAGAEPFPYQQILGMAGLELRKMEHKRATLGFSAERDANGVYLVKELGEDGVATKAGLYLDDVIVNWNGGDVPRRLERWIRGQKAGDVLRLRVRREAKEFDVELRLGEANEVLYQVVEESHASEKARQIREGLLHGVTKGSTAR